ncbi:hypothetical protein INP83_08315 [Mucilaginibacter sp. 21P]|uniref:MAE_28990/MAE_18760 family HEPN-like nuclease n=1 Tax=Mucilaginibacter sp. 21P TaxID=2778902 RepID=UPI001C582FDF|nr:MAE_28990/MAE_18760 family HEPN-like nuclease [Mucilaginibacter sp. 21P]QXV67071.1 hypothetical protein INP83_08315 [Mucilaginibacter sp. 21P]
MAKDLYTYDSLSNKLYDELGWRRKELLLVKNFIPTEKNTVQSAMLRAALPLLYAHWEGFVKLTMSYYLEFVSKRFLKHYKLNTKFIALSLQNKIGDLASADFENRVKIIDFILNKFNSQSNIPKRNIINTKSNLTFSVLKEILFILDIDSTHIEGKKSLINDLVDTRNHIAHGEYKILDYGTFLNFYDDVLSLMEFLKTSIENDATLKKYQVERKDYDNIFDLQLAVAAP